jgi:poly(3-hydroxybutyrate) depolymerase
LAFVYHGAGGNEASAKAFGLQNAPGAAAGGIFVFPRGVPYNGGTIGWQDSCGGYDMVFYDHMRSYLEANYCINPKRVFATGFSWGGDFVTALNCCRGDRLRAVAPASCSDEYANQNDYRTYANSPCPVAQAGAIRFTHQVDGDSGYPSPFFATTSALYRSFNGCSSTSSATAPSPCVAFSGCRQPYVECAYQGIGHALPPNWAAETWAFFVNLP